MITVEQYFGSWFDHADATAQRKASAFLMLEKVNACLEDAASNGVVSVVNPETNSQVSGEKYGGFRPQSCPLGAPKSAHKEARAVDVYDPINALDGWITDAILEQYGLYRESPLATAHWCHLGDRPPPSGKRTFLP